MIKLIILAVVAVIVVVVVVAALAAFSLFRAFSEEPTPLSPEIIAESQAVERKIEDAVADNQAFFLELTDEELSALLLVRVASESSIRDIEASISPGEVEVSGSLGGAPPVPFSGAVDVTFAGGLVDLQLRDASVAFFPVPGGFQEELQPLIDQGLDINRALNESGAAQIQSFDMQEGKVTIVGVQKGGQSVSDSTRDAFISALNAAGPSTPPVPPGADIVPRGTAGFEEPGDPIYLALGDSLAANVGVPLAPDGYVSRFHAYLERETGSDLGLMNLGVSGESSISIMQGQLPQALNEIRQQNVSVLSIDLGANDLLTHLGSSECQAEPRGEVCQSRIDAARTAFDSNFESILSDLSNELDSGTEFYVMTMYNPFDFGLGLPFEDFSNEIVESMNAIIAERANGVGAKLADPYPIMNGNAAAWTNMLQGDIHPNADGFQALAFSLAEARRR